jgi:hypothetical protein
MFFSSRRKRSPDPHLDWKVRLFGLGALLALIGIALESSVFISAAVAVLLSGVLLRFLPSAAGNASPSEEDRGHDGPPDHHAGDGSDS